jgi:sialic acid synthase SpsE
VSHCEAHDVEFLSTPYDPESVSKLQSLGVERFKIASADIVNKPLLEAVAETGAPVLLSTGMASLGEIERAVSFLEEQGVADLTLLHCISCYPTSPEQVNMRFMDTLRTAFGHPVGFSDHTLGTDIGVMAASRGATVLEKHFTLDRSMDGPDHYASVEPDELSSLVDGVEDVTAALGETRRRISSEESENAHRMRRSLHLRHRVEADRSITRDDLKVVRPDDGLDPWAIDEVVGKTLARSVERNEPLDWDDLR